MKKLKTINHKLLLNYTSILVVTLLIVMVIFNVAINQVAYRASLDEIKTAFLTVQVLMKEEIADLRTTDSTPKRPGLREVAQSLNTSLRIARATAGVELFVIDKNHQVVFPKNFDASPLTLESAQTIIDQSRTGQEDNIIVNLQDKRYLVSYSNTLKITQSDHRVVLAAPLDINDAIVKSINRILFFIILSATGLFLLLSRKLAKDITRPIRDAADYANQIAKGHFTPITTKANSAETAILITSLENMSKTLQENEREQTKYLQNFSHDLRTPLMSIQGYAEGISSGVFKDPVQASHIIASESQRLKTLVDQLLTLSRLESVMVKNDLVRVNLKNQLQGIVTRFNGITLQTEKKVIINCNDLQEHMVDTQLFDQCLSNLLSNALKYANQVVIIDVSKVNNDLLVAIKDDGPGIDPEVVPTLFQRFSKGKSGNYGLGLTIAKTAADKMSARLTAHNTDNGAVFELYLP